MDAVKVWAVRLGFPDSEAEGILRLDDEGLTFTLTSEGELRWPLEVIRRAKRVRGSPVLTLDVVEGDEAVRFAFFFVKPPSLSPKGRESKGRAKRRSASYLMMAAPKQKDLIREWERAIDEAIAARRG